MFFNTKSNIPDGVGFNTFDATHLLWLAITLAFWIGILWLYRRSDARRRRRIRLVLGWSIVASEIINDIVMAAIGQLTWDHLPLHLCGINILLIGFDLIKETRVVRSFLYYFCIPGALLALLFPNWTMLPCFNFSHLHSFTIHGQLVLYPLLLVADGEVRAEVKDMLKCIALLIAMAIPIYFVNLLCDTNFMFLMSPETGNPLGLFEQYLGNHLWGFPILLPVVMLIMYLPLKLITKNKKGSV